MNVELWTFRREAVQDPPATLAMARGMGVTDVETASFYGTGQVEWVRFLRAAAKAGVTRYDIEGGSPRAPGQVPLSLHDLRRILFF